MPTNKNITTEKKVLIGRYHRMEKIRLIMTQNKNSHLVLMGTANNLEKPTATLKQRIILTTKK
jgi:hypothetical protein